MEGFCGFHPESVDRPLNHVDAYNPMTDRWVEVSPLRTPRAGIAIALGPNGLIYVFGGTDGAFSPVNTVEADGHLDPTNADATARASAGAATLL
jgi:hypothetical protein